MVRNLVIISLLFFPISCHISCYAAPPEPSATISSQSAVNIFAQLAPLQVSPETIKKISHVVIGTSVGVGGTWLAFRGLKKVITGGSQKRSSNRTHERIKGACMCGAGVVSIYVALKLTE